MVGKHSISELVGGIFTNSLKWFSNEEDWRDLVFMNSIKFLHRKYFRSNIFIIIRASLSEN